MGFAVEAAKLAGLVGALLGWRPGEFWAATPAEVAGIVAALRGKEGEPLEPDRFAAMMEAFPDGR